MKMRVSLFVVCFWVLFWGDTFANEEPSNCATPVQEPKTQVDWTELRVDTLSPTIDAQKEGNALVLGCVNALSGHLVLQQQDMSIPGPQPMVLSRSYSSGTDQWLTLHTGWNCDQLSWCQLHRKGGMNFLGSFYLDNTLYYSMEGGGVVVSDKKSVKEGATSYRLKNGDHSYLGWCASQDIESGKQHRKNLSYSVTEQARKTISITDGAGATRVFSTLDTFTYQKKDKWSADESLFLPIKRLAFPGGYSVSFSSWMENGKEVVFEHNSPAFQQMTYYSPTNQEIGRYTFRPDYTKKERHKHHILEVTTSHGKKVVYSFLPAHNHNKDNTRYYLDSVKCFAKGSEKHFQSWFYDYEKIYGCKGKKIVSCSNPRGHRIFEVDYYTEFDKDKANLGKVKNFSSPVGKGNNQVVLAKFSYYSESSGRFKQGYTHVLFANGRTTSYMYSKNRLIQVLDCCPNDRPPDDYHLYRATLLNWSKDDAVVPGVLLSKRLFDFTNFVPVWNLSYDYSDEGNLVKERLLGDLIGNGSLVEDKKRYLYSDNGKAKNLLDYIETNRTVTRIRYLPDTDLVQTILLEGDSFQKRQFYEYDENRLLIRKIQDDGSGNSPEDLRGIHCRKITEITPLPLLGLPATVIEKYVDPQTHCEHPTLRIDFTYNDDGQKTEQRELIWQDGNWVFYRARRWNYDEAGRCISEIDPYNFEREYKYDRAGNVLEERFAERSRKHQYDAMNRKIETRHEGEQIPLLVETWTYDFFGRQTSHTDIHGRITNHSYDMLGRLVETTFPSVLDEQGHLSSPKEKYAYNCLDQRTAKADALGRVTQYAYTIRGAPSKVNFPNGSSETKLYSVDGLLEKEVRADGIQIQYTHDSFGRVLEETWLNKEGVFQSFVHEYGGLFLLSTTDNGHQTRYCYNMRGQLVEKKEGKQRTEFFYDALGRRVSTRRHVRTGYFIDDREEYDVLDRVICRYEVDSFGNRCREELFEYNPHGEVVEHTLVLESGPAITRNQYDGLGRRTSIVDPQGTETLFLYSSIPGGGECKETVYPDGSRSIEAKDALDHLQSTILYSAEGKILQKQEHRYDLVGNLKKDIFTIFVNGEGPVNTVTHVYSYDVMNRLVEQRECYGSPEEKITRFFYNAAGRKTRIVKPDGVSLFFSYDNHGQLACKWDSLDKLKYQYTYDAWGNLLQVENCKTNQVTVRAYDVYGNVVGEALENGAFLHRTFDHLGRPHRITLQDGSFIWYQYTGSQMIGVDRRDVAGKLLYSHRYESDLQGHVVREHLPLDHGTVEHRYDICSRWLCSAHPLLRMETSGYDVMGNLLDFQSSTSLGVTRDRFSYDSLNQLVEEEGESCHSYLYDSFYNRLEKDGISDALNDLQQVVQRGQVVYSYDRNGNLLSISSPDGLCLLSYDSLDRLVQVETGEERVVYTYDGMDRRVAKTFYRFCEDKWVERSRQLFLYDGDNEIGTFSDQGIEILRVLGRGHGAELGAAVMIEKGPRSFVPLHSPFGHLALLVDRETHLPVQHFRTTAYGEVSVLDGKGVELTLVESESPWIVSSKRSDGETGFVFYGKRYYDPVLGRWISPDPVGFEDGPNLYVYLKNNPLYYTDLYGLTVQEFCDGFGSAGVHMIVVRLGLTALTVMCPPVGAAATMAYQAYGIYALATTAYTIGGHLLSKTLEQGGDGFLEAAGDVGSVFTSSQSIGNMLAGVVARRAPGKFITVKNVRKGVVTRTQSELELLNHKLKTLRSVPQKSVRTRLLPDGRIRYYGLEEPSENAGRTRGRSFVLEHNPKRCTVRTWMESYGHDGSVIRVHPKQVNGEELEFPHYPPIGKELALYG